MYSEERRPWWFWLVLFGGISTTGLAVYLGLGGGSAEAGGEAPTAPFALPFVVIVPLVAWITTASRRYFVDYGSGQLIVGYPSWNVTLPPSELLSAQAVDIRWMAWGGFGWRLRGLKHIGYIASAGPGLQLETSREGRSYTFSCKDPERLLEALAADGVRVLPPASS